MYPEIYWELTALLHDEAVPPDEALSEHDMNRLWWVALLRLSRLGWFRQGSIPAPARERLRQIFDVKLPLVQREAVRLQLRAILTDNPLQTEDSYAAASRAFTMARLDYESAAARPGLSEDERAQLQTDFRETVATVNLSEIEAAIGRKLSTAPIWPEPPKGPDFEVLWIDDKPETNQNFQKTLQEELPIRFVNMRSTEEALETLAERGFHLIISDTKRQEDTRAGIKMMQIFQEKTDQKPPYCSVPRSSAQRAVRRSCCNWAQRPY